MKEKELDKVGKRLDTLVNLMLVWVFVVILLVVIVGIATQSVFWCVVTALAGIAVLVFVGKRGNARMERWQADRQALLDFEAMIGRYIRLDSFQPDGGFDRRETDALLLEGVPYRLKQKNLIRGTWQELRVSSAWVDFYNFNRGVDASVDLIKGQMTIVERQAAFPGRLLLLRRSASKAQRDYLVRQTGLAETPQDVAPSLSGQWRIFSSSEEAVRRLFAQNESLVKRLSNAPRVCF